MATRGKRNNSSGDQSVAHRRTLVSRMRLKGMTQREIARRLDVSLGTVNKDIQAITEDWQAQAATDLGIHKARIVAELQEVKRRAWAFLDLNAVLKALEQERAVLGVDAPKRIDMNILIDREVERLHAIYPTLDKQALRQRLQDAVESGVLQA